ncbi:MAG: hypothetical protein WAU65_01165 [Candidatus Nanoarchaeia archaeon]
MADKKERSGKENSTDKYRKLAETLEGQGRAVLGISDYDKAASYFGNAGKALVYQAHHTENYFKRKELLRSAKSDYVSAKNLILELIQERNPKTDIKDLWRRRNDLDNTIKAIDSTLNSKSNKDRGTNLEGVVKAILLPLAILSFIGSVATISLNATGNVIANSSGYNSSFFGILLFLLGGVFVFAFLKIRGKK